MAFKALAWPRSAHSGLSSLVSESTDWSTTRIPVKPYPVAEVQARRRWPLLYSSRVCLRGQGEFEMIYDMLLQVSRHSPIHGRPPWCISIGVSPLTSGLTCQWQRRDR